MRRASSPLSVGLAAAAGLLLLAALAAAQAQAVVRVGVILTSRSSAVRTGIQMAVEDYRAARPGSAARVELHFRDSAAGDVVGAASAAVDLIKNAQVDAIIGPATSAEAKFVAHIGSRAHVPVLSYSATSPALSPAHTPYFVRTAANDSLQAAPVAAILAAFRWGAAAVVHEDSPYGVGILPALADALQGAGVVVTNRTAVPLNASDDLLDAALRRFMALQTRVFVVHMMYPLVARFFHRAKIAGMMSQGYVWVATDAVGSSVELLPPDMQGVVTLRPHVELTDNVRNFSARFAARLRRDNPTAADEDVHEPAVTRLWAYDTVWAIASAAEAAGVDPGAEFQTPRRSTTTLTDMDRLGVSVTGSALLRSLLATTFDGMAGKFKLVDGQLQLAAYEVVNVVGKGGRTVGFWTPETSISQDLNQPSSPGTPALRQILWPGEQQSTPKGWTASPNGRELTVLVPVKHGFKQFVNVSGGSPAKVTGYCIDVFDEVMSSLPYRVKYSYKSFKYSSESYEKLVEQVRERRADIVVGDVTITASRMQGVAYTMPFTESGWSMVVAARKDASAGMWIFLRPLTTGLWLASLAFFCFTGFAVWVVEHRINPEFRGTPWQQFGLVFYFAFSTLVFSHKEKLVSNMSRLVVTIWVFVVLILTSSYTASLTSMLTVQKLQPAVTDARELQRRGQYIGYQEGSFIEPLLHKMGFDAARMKKYISAEQYADALSRGSENSGVDAVFDEIPYLKLFLSQYCDGYMMVGPVHKADGFGFVFPIGAPMVEDVSREILKLAEGEKMARIEKRWFGEPAACQSQSAAVGSSNLTFQSFGGLFLITGVVSTLMLLLFLATFAYRERVELRAAAAAAVAEDAAGGSGSGSLPARKLRAWLQHYDSKDLKSPTFKAWNDGSTTDGRGSGNRTPRWNGGGGGGGGMDMTPRTGEGEGAAAVGAASPLSVYMSSEVNDASSPPAGTPTSEVGSSFDHRTEDAESSMEMATPLEIQLQ